jgi:hypothetical protein
MEESCIESSDEGVMRIWRDGHLFRRSFVTMRLRAVHRPSHGLSLSLPEVGPFERRGDERRND